jgi:hypothetical protein
MMKLALALSLAAPAAFAAPRCSGGGTPRLNGDLFAPVDCSSATKTAPSVPGAPVTPSGDGVKNDLRDLDGRWEGSLIHGLGRYALLAALKTSWNGKVEATLEWKELQFRERATDKLVLTPAKGRGAYAAVLTTTLAPDASLAGTAAIGGALTPLTSSSTVITPDRQADVSFANGAGHRVYFQLNPSKTEMRVRAFSGIPGAPLQKFEIVFTRTKRESL